jgi:hypothetical protein
MKFLLTAFLGFSLMLKTQAQLVINEVCYDPSNTALLGDANGDGAYDQTEDEFVEFVNTGTSDLDISRYRICDRVLATGLKTVRHTVAMGTIIPPNGAFVVFGGGSAVGTFGGAIVRIDVGTQGLSLNNSGESVLIEDSLGNFVDSLDTDALSDNPNESYTRNPDVTGNFVQHATAAPGTLFSPGTRPDGTPFNTVLSVRSDASFHQFKVWPNPAGNKVQFTIKEGEKAMIEVYNSTGNLVTNLASTNGNLDISSFPNGVYLFRATVNEKSFFTRLLIAR